MRISEFIDSPKGRWNRHMKRVRQRFYAQVTGVEPQSKRRMPDSDRIRFQSSIIEQLIAQGRKPFRGPLALELAVKTTEANPAHAQTVAKNLLDLLGRPLVSQSGFRGGTLYFDDDQIQALSVTCAHGAALSVISIAAAPFGDLLEDLDLAMYAASSVDEPDAEEESVWRRLAGPISDFSSADEREMRQVLGDEFYEYQLSAARGDAQYNLLTRANVSLRELGSLYSRRGEPVFFRDHLRSNYSLKHQSEEIFRDRRLRIVLGELPQEAGTSLPYRNAALAKIREFQERYPRLLKSLNIPVALIVVIKPALVTRGKHDLDNVLRDYLIPKVVDLFQPPSSLHWALETRRAATRLTTQKTGKVHSIERPPASTRTGLSRYEAWRLTRHPQDISPGFVSIAIVPDMFGMEGVFSKIDRAIGRWESSID